MGDLEKILGSEDLLRGLDVGKCCIRIKKRTEIGKTGLDMFIQRAVALWRKGAKLDG